MIKISINNFLNSRRTLVSSPSDKKRYVYLIVNKVRSWYVERRRIPRDKRGCGFYD